MRNCCEVIGEILKVVPTDEGDFIEALNWNYDDASYKAPEQTIQWTRTSETLLKYIQIPREDWHFEVLEIFTTKTRAQLELEVAEYNKNK